MEWKTSRVRQAGDVFTCDNRGIVGTDLCWFFVHDMLLSNWREVLLSYKSSRPTESSHRCLQSTWALGEDLAHLSSLFCFYSSQLYCYSPAALINFAFRRRRQRFWTKKLLNKLTAHNQPSTKWVADPVWLNRWRLLVETCKDSRHVGISKQRRHRCDQ